MEGDNSEDDEFNNAVQALLEYGFPETVIHRTLRTLLKVYGGESGWPLLKENNYAVVIERILTDQDEKIHKDDKLKQKQKPHVETQFLHEGANGTERNRYDEALDSNKADIEDGLVFTDKFPLPNLEEPDIYVQQRRLWMGYYDLRLPPWLDNDAITKNLRPLNQKYGSLCISKDYPKPSRHQKITGQDIMGMTGSPEPVELKSSEVTILHSKRQCSSAPKDPGSLDFHIGKKVAVVQEAACQFVKSIQSREFAPTEYKNDRREPANQEQPTTRITSSWGQHRGVQGCESQEEVAMESVTQKIKSQDLRDGINTTIISRKRFACLPARKRVSSDSLRGKLGNTGAITDLKMSCTHGPLKKKAWTHSSNTASSGSLGSKMSSNCTYVLHDTTTTAAEDLGRMSATRLTRRRDGFPNPIFRKLLKVKKIATSMEDCKYENFVRAKLVPSQANSLELQYCQGNKPKYKNSVLITGMQNEANAHTLTYYKDREQSQELVGPKTEAGGLCDDLNSEVSELFSQPERPSNFPNREAKSLCDSPNLPPGYDTPCHNLTTLVASPEGRKDVTQERNVEFCNPRDPSEAIGNIMTSSLNHYELCNRDISNCCKNGRLPGVVDEGNTITDSGQAIIGPDSAKENRRHAGYASLSASHLTELDWRSGLKVNVTNSQSTSFMDLSKCLQSTTGSLPVLAVPTYIQNMPARFQEVSGSVLASSTSTSLEMLEVVNPSSVFNFSSGPATSVLVPAVAPHTPYKSHALNMEKPLLQDSTGAVATDVCSPETSSLSVKPSARSSLHNYSHGRFSSVSCSQTHVPLLSSQLPTPCSFPLSPALHTMKTVSTSSPDESHTTHNCFPLLPGSYYFPSSLPTLSCDRIGAMIDSIAHCQGPSTFGSQSHLPSKSHPLDKDNKAVERGAVGKSVLIGGIPPDASNMVPVLQELVNVILTGFEFVPGSSTSISNIDLQGDHASIEFLSEGIANIFHDICHADPSLLRINGEQLITTGSKEFWRADTTMSCIRLCQTVNPANVFYVGGIPEHWHDTEKLTHHFSNIVMGNSEELPFSQQEVVVHLFPDFSDAFLQLSSEMQANLLIYRCSRNHSYLQTISKTAFLCRHRNFTPRLAYLNKVHGLSKCNTDMRKPQSNPSQAPYPCSSWPTLIPMSLPMIVPQASITHSFNSNDSSSVSLYLNATEHLHSSNLFTVGPERISSDQMVHGNGWLPPEDDD